MKYDKSRRYTQRLQCPKCKSFNCCAVEEKYHLHITNTKKNGWLSKKTYDLGTIGTNCFHFECKDCEYGRSTLERDNNDEFIIEEKEVKDNESK